MKFIIKPSHQSAHLIPLFSGFWNKLWVWVNIFEIFTNRHALSEGFALNS